MVEAAWELVEAAHPDAPKLFSTAGVHPHDASAWSHDAEVTLRELAARREVVAIGECGLDFESTSGSTSSAAGS